MRFTAPAKLIAILIFSLQVIPYDTTTNTDVSLKKVDDQHLQNRKPLMDKILRVIVIYVSILYNICSLILTFISLN
jgi:hypothetical protein